METTAKEFISTKLFVEMISKKVNEHYDAYSERPGSTVHEQMYSIMERYGIATHQQYYNLIQQTSLHINNGGYYGKVRQILVNLSNETEFRNGAYYAAGVFNLCAYRYPLQVDKEMLQLIPVIRSAIKFRTLGGASDPKKCLVSLGLLVFQREAIPFLLRLTDDVGYKYHFSSKRHNYYTHYLPCIKKYIGLLETEMEIAIDEMKIGQKKFVQSETLSVYKEIEQYIYLVLKLI
jgi:hypothetical protein